MAKKLTKNAVAWAVGFNDWLIQSVTRTGGALRYRSDRAYGSEPKREPRHNRDKQAGLARLRPKAMVHHPHPLEPHIHPRSLRG